MNARGEYGRKIRLIELLLLPIENHIKIDRVLVNLESVVESTLNTLILMV